MRPGGPLVLCELDDLAAGQIGGDGVDNAQVAANLSVRAEHELASLALALALDDDPEDLGRMSLGISEEARIDERGLAPALSRCSNRSWRSPRSERS